MSDFNLVLARIEDAARRGGTLDEVLAHLLQHALETAGVPLGLIYLCGAQGLELRARRGVDGDGPRDFFGRTALLDAALAAGRPAPLEDGSALFAAAGAGALLAVPLVLGAQRLGVLVLGAPAAKDRWLDDAGPLSVPIAQAIALTQAIEQLTRERERSAASEQLLRQVTEAIPEVFYIADREMTQMFYISPAYEKIWGRTCASLIAAPRSWADAIHPEDRAASTAVIDAEARGQPFEQAYRIVRPDGSVRYIRDHGFPVADASGRIVRYAGIAMDVTDTKLAEEELARTQEQLRRSQKMEAVGRLAGGVAHDFNNVLTVMQGYADLLAEEIDTRDPLHEAVDAMLKAVSRATALTRQLLVFSRHERVSPQVLDVNAVTAELEQMLRRVIGEHIELEVGLDPGAGRARIDRGYLEQVLLNLCVNARDAMPRGGKLAISTTRVRKVPKAALGAAAGAGPHVQIAVTDEGVGMTDEVLANIFEPFYTTKGPGQGTGLGLSTVYGIVTNAGGRIGVDSRPGRGSSFRIYLPVVDEALTAVAPVEAPAPALRGAETILLVEDDELVRELADRVLRRAGYHVLTCMNGGDALLTCEQHSGPIALVITDVVMPKMSGPELVARLETVRPGVKALFCSGYTHGSLAHDAVRGSGRAFIQKPFGGRELAEKVRALLDDKGSV